MDALMASATLPRASTLEPTVAPWLGPTLDAAVADVDMGLLAYAPDFTSECPSVASRVATPSRTALATVECAMIRGNEPQSPVVPPLDDSSPAQLRDTALAGLILDPKFDARGAFARVNGALTRETTRVGKARLAALGSCLLQASGDTDAALDMALRSIAAQPRSSLNPLCDAFNQVASLMGGTATDMAAARAWAAWRPFSPVRPRDLAARGTKEWLTAARRAYTLAPFNVDDAVDLAVGLLHDNLRSEARSVAVGLTDGALHHAAATLILARVDASEAQFDAALARLRRELATAGSGGYLDTEAFELWRFARDLALLLGRERELADEFVASFVDRGRPAISSSDDVAVGVSAAICMYASRASAQRCFTKLRALVGGTNLLGLQPVARALLVGAEAFAKHDFQSATAAWRPLARGLAAQAAILADAVPMALTSAGEADLAARIDAPLLDGHGPFNGVSSAYVRAALDSERRGDHARARRFAQSVVDAWATADVQPPAMTAMRALLAR
jgi:hypothetical protein